MSMDIINYFRSYKFGLIDIVIGSVAFYWFYCHPYLKKYFSNKIYKKLVQLKKLIKKGDINKIIKFYNDNYVIINIFNIYQGKLIDYSFAYACAIGRLDVAKWLISIKPSINISVDDEYAFCRACEYGHLEIAKWLISIKPDINISTDDDYAFKFSCENCHLDVAKWLLSIKPSIDISADDEYVFRYACEYGYLEIAKWLISIKPSINISAENDYAFRNACINNNLEIVKWLSSINQNYKVTIINDEIVNFYVFRKIPLDLTKKINRKTIDKEDNKCPICWEDNVNIQSNCKHNFCRECIEIIYINDDKCPYCRKQFESFYLIK